MKTAVAWVRDALATKDIVQHLTHYKVADGFIYAADGRMLAAHPFPSPDSFLVPGSSFDKSLAATKVDSPVIAPVDGGIEIRDKKFRSKIATIDPSLWPMGGLEYEKWHELPQSFINALKAVRPFVSDNATQPWATAIGVVGTNLFATNNIVIVRAWTGAKEALPSILIPSWVADFILARTAGLNGWGMDEGSIYFRWENGGWLRAASLNGTFPERAGAIIDGTADAALFEITAEWRETYLRVASLTEKNELSLYADRIVGGSGDELFVEDELETPAPEGEDRSVWNPKFLTPVVEIATGWDPGAWPNPARFQADGVEGVVTGRRPS